MDQECKIIELQYSCSNGHARTRLGFQLRRWKRGNSSLCDSERFQKLKNSRCARNSPARSTSTASRLLLHFATRGRLPKYLIGQQQAQS